MLPAAHRMRRSADFTAVVRGGSRVAARRMVVHHRPGAGDTAPLVGLIVGKSVGGSVVRHRVSRRLRAQLAGRLDLLAAGSSLVVRALPAAANATSADLGADLDRALARVIGR